MVTHADCIDHCADVYLLIVIITLVSWAIYAYEHSRKRPQG